MGWIVKTPAGTYRVNWRDPAGKQRARTFRTKKEAQRFEAQVEHEVAQGTYVDPHAARRVLLRDYAAQWLAGLNVEVRTREKAGAMLRTHVAPQWGDWPLAKIDHMSVQQWVTDLGTRRAPATVAEAFGVLSRILEIAVRARLLAVNPCDGVRLPSSRGRTSRMRTISRVEFRDRLLPAVPDPHRALVCLAAGAGLGWGECVGLGWDGLDLEGRDVHVFRVVVETPGSVCSVTTRSLGPGFDACRCQPSLSKRSCATGSTTGGPMTSCSPRVVACRFAARRSGRWCGRLRSTGPG